MGCNNHFKCRAPTVERESQAGLLHGCRDAARHLEAALAADVHLDDVRRAPVREIGESRLVRLVLAGGALHPMIGEIAGIPAWIAATVMVWLVDRMRPLDSRPVLRGLAGGVLLGAIAYFRNPDRSKAGDSAKKSESVAKVNTPNTPPKPKPANSTTLIPWSGPAIPGT